MSFGGGSDTTVQDNAFSTGPFAPQIPFINRLFQEAGNFLNQGPQAQFPGSTVAPVNTNLAASQDQLAGVGAGATAQSAPFVGAAQDLATGNFPNATAEAGAQVC